MAATIELSTHEIQGLCQRYFKEQTTEAAASVEQRNFQVLSYKVQSTSDAPAGFLGRHQILSVGILLKDAVGRERQEMVRFFTKSAPTDISSRMDYLEEFGVFKKEIAVYREVLPQLQTFYPDVAAKCYYAAKTLLVFEDLGQLNYRMAAGRDGLLDYTHLKCALKTLAAMHAGSIVYELQQSQQLPQLHTAAVLENAYPSGIDAQHVRAQNFNNANEVFQQIIKELPQYREQLSHILSEFPKQMEIIFELVKPSTKYRSVFSHGDLWANNVMYHYGNFGEVPIHARLVDFQLARYAPPAIDLVTLLTIPTSRRFREQYWNELICDYYNFMTEFLKREGLCIADFLPRSQFFESVAEFRICGLIESCLFSHLTILPPVLTQQLTGTTDGFSDFFDRKRVQICMEAFHTDRVYRERLTDMIGDLVDNFVLK